jgi:histidyl-tRNA synthetase
MKEIRAVKGTSDILPPQSYLWQHVEQVCRSLAEKAGYLEIRTPIFEETALFERSIGETTEVVEKQMYTFTTPGGEQITLRPEMTAPTMRAYLENNLHKKGAFRKFYYIGPSFRYERPQAGRSRQFHQFGVEAIGSKDPLLDAETIILAWDIATDCGIPGLTLHINSIGCAECRPKYRQSIAAEVKRYLPSLCEDCVRRAERNLFRVFDCKKETCRKIIAQLPPVEASLCSLCKNHFEKVKEFVSKYVSKWEIDPHLVRGLDYYTNTVYELTAEALGAQDSIGGGGRYDYLIRDLGGPEIPAVGFALGLDRMILALSSSEAQNATNLQPKTTLFLATVSESEREFACDLLIRLRRSGIAADMDFEAKSLKSQLRQADKSKAKFVAVIGQEEVQNSFVKLKELASGKEEKVKIDALPARITQLATDNRR